MALVGGEVDEQGVDLHDLARPGGLEALGQAAGVALFAGEAEAATARLAPGWARARHAALHELGEDAPDGRNRDGDALAAQHTAILRLPHMGLSAAALDRLASSARPCGRRTRCGRRLFSSALLPAIQRRPGAPDALRGRGGTQARAPSGAPALKRVASDRRFDYWGLRVDQTRRGPAVADNMAGQAKTCIGGPPELVCRNFSFGDPEPHSSSRLICV